MAAPAKIHPNNLITGIKYYTNDPDEPNELMYLGTYICVRRFGPDHDPNIELVFRNDCGEIVSVVWDFKSYFYEAMEGA
jgi:hypothetical protein